MKRAFIALLITIMALPAFLQVMPHGVDHALHQSKTHHVQNTHGHNHGDHHEHEVHDENHHAINLDIITYYDEYLHADLQSPDQMTLKQPVADVQDIDLDVTANIALASRDELFAIRSRAPPDWRRLKPESTPLYLSTQRLRI